MPTSVELRLPASAAAWKAGEMRWPAPRRVVDPVLKFEIPVYEGTVTTVMALTVPADVPEGAMEFDLVFKAQACDDRACYPPVAHALTLNVTVDKESPRSVPRHPQIFGPLGIQ
jgi:hypothetical protein